MAFTDGRVIGATLDRNGLRPGRFVVTHDGLVVMASEAGVLDIDPEDIKTKGRLQPGKMFLVDTVAGRIIADKEIKRQLASRQPYQQWLETNQNHHGAIAGAVLRSSVRYIPDIADERRQPSAEPRTLCFLSHDAFPSLFTIDR